MRKRELRTKDKYIENELYSFHIEKEIDFEGEIFYVLKSQFNENHLLPKLYYSDYELNIGNTILCYVDKINCAGEIFLEPIHPFYKLGEVYNFKIIKSGTCKFKEIIEFGLFLENKFSQESFVVCSREFAANAVNFNSIDLKLVRIKKGVFHLQISH